jgi:hypothetical protein
MRRLGERKERKACRVIYDLPSGKKDRIAIKVPDDHLVETRIEKELLKEEQVGRMLRRKNARNKKNKMEVMRKKMWQRNMRRNEPRTRRKNVAE